MSLLPEAMDARECHIQGAWFLEERELEVCGMSSPRYDRLVAACSNVGVSILGTAVLGTVSGICRVRYGEIRFICSRWCRDV